MALAVSLEDCTRGVVHGVIPDDNAKEVVNYFQASGKSIPCITAVWELIVLNLMSPENIT
jgi:hypothetical protein